MAENKDTTDDDTSDVGFVHIKGKISDNITDVIFIWFVSHYVYDICTDSLAITADTAMVIINIFIQNLQIRGIIQIVIITERE